MPLTPGIGPNPVADSMANAMLAAFKNQWPSFMDTDLPDDEKLANLRHMFVAISQGVVQHLRDNPDAFQVAVDSAGVGVGEHTHTARVDSITATGTSD